MEVRKELGRGRGGNQCRDREDIIIGDIKQEKERWSIIEVYVDEGIEEVMTKKVESWIDRTGGNRKMLLGGGF